LSQIQDHVLWLDLETTGIDEFNDLILEVGAVLMPRDCSVELFHFVNVVDPNAPDWKSKLATEVREMHERNGLIEAIDSGVGEPLRDVEERLLDNLRAKTQSTNHVILAGSGVSHFDRRFIRQQMPRLDRALTYWSWDVGIVRRFFVEAVPDGGFLTTSPRPHRALLDTRLNIREWQRFVALASFLRKGPHADEGRGPTHRPG
jgi:oligoribonuclease